MRAVMFVCARCRPMAPARAPRRWPTAMPISPSSAAISTCRKTPRPWRRCARMWRCSGCPRQRRARAKSPARRSPRFRSSPDAASVSSAAPRPMSICSGSSCSNMASIRTRSTSFNFRPPRPRTPSTTRRRPLILPRVRSTARSPRMPSTHRRVTAVRRHSWRSIPPRRLRRTIRFTRHPKFPPAPSAARPPGPMMR